jgi:hypothetical protein
MSMHLYCTSMCQILDFNTKNTIVTDMEWEWYCNIISTGPYNNPSAVYPDIALHISNYYISSLSDSVLVQKSSVHVHVEVWI